MKALCVLLLVLWSSVASAQNRAPVVSAGADVTVPLQATGIALNGAASDDGLPGPLTVLWTKMSGPGTVTFATATTPQTTATFSLPGIYILRLTARDGALTSTDDVTVTVQLPEPTLTATPTTASTSVRATRFTLLNGPCTMSSGTGPPTVLPGCDTYINATDGKLFAKSTDVAAVTSPGDLTIGPVGNNMLPDRPYSVNIGMLTRKFLTLHAAELWVETLVAQSTLATIGGRIVVAPTNTLCADVPATAGVTTIQWKYNNLNPGDAIWLEGNGKFEFMGVQSGPVSNQPCGTTTGYGYNYNMVRNLDGSSVNAWNAGDAGVNTGAVGNGFIDLYSVRSGKCYPQDPAGGCTATEIGPTIVGNVRTGTAFNAWSPRWAAGNLRGLYGVVGDIYGFAAGSWIDSATGTNILIDSTAGTGGIKIRNGNNNIFNADTVGNLTLASNLTVGAGGKTPLTMPLGFGVIRSASADAYNVGNGFWFQSDGWARIGDPAGNQLLWDRTSLTVIGNGNGLTNINGANIVTGSISVGAINATGWGDNMIANGTFEGPNAVAGTDGWIVDVAVGASGAVWTACCGINGPGLLLLSAGNPGDYTFYTYRALAVRPGDVYRFGLTIYAPSVMSGTYVRLQESNNGNFVTRVRYTSPAAGEVTMSSYTDLCGACAFQAGWGYYEYTYTVPSGVYWMSPQVINFTSPTNGNIQGIPIYIDDVQMSRKLGTGSILANSITANLIAANQITAGHIQAGAIDASKIAARSITADRIQVGGVTGTEIAGGAITTGKIAANTITGANIAGSTITGGNISGGTITGGNIAGGTITGGHIVAHSISANELTVGSLSAITATMGSLNSGTITSSTMFAGSATIDSNGVSLQAGGDTGKWYKWNNSQVGLNYDGGAWLVLAGASALELNAGGNRFFFRNNVNGAIQITNLSGYGNRYLCVNNNGEFYLGTGPTKDNSC